MLPYRWEPRRNTPSMRRILDRLFDDRVTQPIFLRPLYWEQNGKLRMDIYHTHSEFVIKAIMQGVKAEEIDITITTDGLTIDGKAAVQEEIKAAKYLLRERGRSSFHRSGVLPDGLDAQEADATLENGILTLRIPTASESSPKTIKLNVNDPVFAIKKE